MPQNGGRLFFRHAVEPHGARLQQHNLIVLVHGPFHILRILVMAFQLHNHVRKLAHLVVAEAGHVLQVFRHGR